MAELAERIVHPDPVNWNSLIFCIRCDATMIVLDEYGWTCLDCGATIMFERDEVVENWGGKGRWRFRPEGLAAYGLA